MEILRNYPLIDLHTFGINERADLYAAFHSATDLNELLGVSAPRRMLLGGGSNVLFTTPYRGLVMHNCIMGIEVIKETADHIWIRVGAGENWHQLVEWCVTRDYGGIENLSLIPGTVGAAPMQNIGAYGVELRSVFHSLEAFHLSKREVESFDPVSCRFGYRTSIFKTDERGQYAILNVTLRLTKRRHRYTTSYGEVRSTLQAMGVDENLVSISTAIIKIRQQKLPDPKQIGNAGSFFKNPIITETSFAELKNRFSDIPSYAVDAVDHVKVPAAWLIEQCGWKGRRNGGAACYHNHALVLTNADHATGQEVKDLSQQIRQSVQDKFGLWLEYEVNVY